MRRRQEALDKEVIATTGCLRVLETMCLPHALVLNSAVPFVRDSDTRRCVKGQSLCMGRLVGATVSVRTTIVSYDKNTLSASPGIDRSWGRKTSPALGGAGVFGVCGLVRQIERDDAAMQRARVGKICADTGLGIGHGVPYHNLSMGV